jgi:uncharacterized membrane protein
MHPKHFLMYVIPALMACNNHTKDNKGSDSDSITIEKEADTTKPANIDTNKTVEISKEPAADTLFTGLGTEPFWSLNIIKDKEILFTTADGPEVSFPYVKLNRSGNEYRCISTKGRASIVLKITKKKCMDAMSEREYDYEVLAVVSTVAYRGCGSHSSSSGSLDQ